MASDNSENSVYVMEGYRTQSDHSINYSDTSFESSARRSPLAEINQNSEFFNGHKNYSAFTVADSDDTDYEMHNDDSFQAFDGRKEYNSTEYDDSANVSLNEATHVRMTRKAEPSVFLSRNVKSESSFKPVDKSTPNSVPRANMIISRNLPIQKNKPKNPSPLSTQISHQELTVPTEPPLKSNRFLDFIPKMGIPPAVNTADDLRKATVLGGSKGYYAKITTPSPKKLEPKHASLLRSNRIELQQRLMSAKATSSSSSQSGQYDSSSPDSDNLPLNSSLKGRRQASRTNRSNSGNIKGGTKPPKTTSHLQEDEWQDEYPEYSNGADGSQLSTVGTPHSAIYVGHEDSFYSTPEAPLPVILSSYLQLFFNLILVAFFVYLVYVVVSTIRHDVDLKVEEYSQDILNEIAQCSNEYIRNNCMPGRRVPALEKTCSSWEKCMNQDPAVVGRAKVSAETFAEIINSFIEPFGFKAMGFIVTLFLGAAFANNVAFGVRYRQSMYAQGPPPAAPPQQRPRYPHTPKYYYTPRSGMRNRKRISPRRILMDR
jgi:Di-sulfide bridge nucleocytoplasmic transport domain